MILTRRTILASGAALAAGADQARAAVPPNEPEPIAGSKGASDLGPRDPIRDRQNPDLLTALHRFHPRTGTDKAWELPAWVGCFVLTDAGAVVALSTGLYHLDLASGILTPMAHAPFDARRFIFNDGGADRGGRFFAGTMYLPLGPGDRSGAEPASPLWRYDGGCWSAVTPPVKTSNGLAWSPDGRVMDHSDTSANTIWAWGYDTESGTPYDRRLFARLDVEDPQGGPDGAAVDSEGFYWCAVFGDGAVLRIDPDGRIERRIAMPVKYPTMPAFGGPDLKTLYVTSALWPIPPEERGRHPDEGSLFALEAPARGLPTSRFEPRSHP